MADCLDLLPEFAEPIVLLGGGAHSAAWRRIAADVTGRAFAVASAAEPGALGVALLAGMAAGWWSGMDKAVAACCKRGAAVLPDRDARAEYRPLLARYRRLRRELIEEQQTRRAERERATRG